MELETAVPRRYSWFLHSSPGAPTSTDASRAFIRRAGVPLFEYLPKGEHGVCIAY
jgi:hypothetical protein